MHGDSPLLRWTWSDRITLPTMDPAPTQYVDREGVALAYQVVGDGPAEVVNFLEITQHLDLAWSTPDLHSYFEHAASFSRTVYFQRRGFGLSDQIAYVPTLEQQADDVLAVMDAVGMPKATLVGVYSTCGAVALVAAKAPERVRGLVLVDPVCGGSKTSGPTPGWTDAEHARYFEALRSAYANWGSGGIVDIWDPVLATPYNRRLMAMLERCSATPSVAYPTTSGFASSTSRTS